VPEHLLAVGHVLPLLLLLLLLLPLLHLAAVLGIPRRLLMENTMLVPPRLNTHTHTHTHTIDSTYFGTTQKIKIIVLKKSKTTFWYKLAKQNTKW
jgi:hypothetical protein